MTAVANGDATITATCGDYSTSCSVAVSGIEEESGEVDDTALVYSLPEETVFDGSSSYIDTEVQLFDTDKDFTVTIEFTGDDNPVSMEALLHCVYESSPWPGVSVDVLTSGAIAGYYRLYDSIITTIPNNSTDKHRMVFVKNAAAGNITYYWDDAANYKINSSANVVSATHESHLVLGAKRAVSGAISNFWGGTIHKCAVYNRQFTADEISAYLIG